MKLAVTVLVDVDIDETLTGLSKEDVKRSVQTAIIRAIEHAQDMGFSHELSDKVSILFDYVKEPVEV